MKSDEESGLYDEPKFVTVNMESATGEDLGRVSYIPIPNVDYIPKQETLEEFAKRFTPQSDKWTIKEIFIEGAKWQQERSYSEEDMLKSFMAGIKCESNNGKNFEQLIKEFKKK